MQFSEPDEEQAGINLTSLIDVVFLLLIFFMITSTFIKVERKLDLQLPEAKAAEVEQKERKPIQIEMDKRGRITLDGQLVTMKALEAKLKEFQGKRKSAVVRADRRLKHGTVTAVLGLCRDAGIREIAIAVK
ncbi:MAG: biopolymer transporter ExbD [candidate division NC10 bacterium]|jgi:biopolymer transport protein ExbD